MMTKRMLFLVVLIVGCFGRINAQAQSETTAQNQWSVAQQSAVSFIGLHTAVLGQWNKQRWQVYLGPKLQLSQSDGLGNGTWGITAGTRFITGHSANQKLHSFVSAQTQFTFADGGCSQDCPFELQLINEGFFIFGYQYDWGKHFFLSGGMGIGYQLESVELQGFDSPQRFTDINGTITFGFGYRFAH